MSRWQEQYENHQIKETLHQLNDWLDVDVDELNEGDIEEIRRCKKILTIFDESLHYFDPETISFANLDSFNQQLRHQNLWGQLNSFNNNSDVGHVKNANEHLTSLLPVFASISSSKVESSAEKKLIELEKTIDASIESLVASKNDLKNKLSSLSAKLESIKTDNNELEQIVEQRRQEVDQQISQWQQQFSDAQEKRSAGYAEWKDKIESELRSKTSEIVKDTTNEIDEMSETSKESLNKTVAAAEQKHDEIVELFQLASGDSISGGYAQSANKERFQSNLWRGFAVGFICITAIWIFSAYHSAIERNTPKVQQVSIPVKDKQQEQVKTTETTTAEHSVFDLSAFLLSVSLTGVLLYGAAFSGLQSNRHRENEKQMRWFALQIKALDPYINSLNEEDQKELKKTLSEKFFTAPSDSNGKDNVLSEHAVSTLAKAMADVVKASKG